MLEAEVVGLLNRLLSIVDVASFSLFLCLKVIFWISSSSHSFGSHEG